MANPLNKFLKITNDKTNNVAQRIKLTSEKTILINEMYSELINKKKEKIDELDKKLSLLNKNNINYKKDIDELVEKNNSLKLKINSIESLLIENINTID
ncbi:MULTISPECIES: hypothetical protein [Clostridium]|uniref:hypothetical protein n=1 Tax=Clostridium TaxID=1485 RepID=UPI000826B420|nr:MULTISPECIES: hypothetical protein [Clostridium]PJI07351.1 hypothetical protein CUB90_05505 [Clostridium sp. CT7]